MSLDFYSENEYTGSLKLFQLETPNGKVNGKLLKFGSSESVTLILDGIGRSTSIGVSYDAERDAIYVSEEYEEKISVPYQDFVELYTDALDVKTPQDVIALLRKVYDATKDMDVYSALKLAESLNCNTGDCIVQVSENEAFENKLTVVLNYDNPEKQNGMIYFDATLVFNDETGKILFKYNIDELVRGDKRAVNYIRKKMMDVNDYKDVVRLLYEIEEMKEGELF